MLACNPCAVSSGRPPPPTATPPTSYFFSSALNKNAEGKQNTYGRGEKRKNCSNDKNCSTTSEKNVGTKSPQTSYTTGIASKVKHLLPSVGALHSNDVKNDKASYSRLWKRRRKVSDESKNGDILKKNSDISNNGHAKNKLLTIVQNDRMTSQTAEKECGVVVVEKTVEEIKPPDDHAKPKPGSFFQRGNHLMSSVRSSLRKMGYHPPKKAAPEIVVVPDQTVDVVEELTCLKLEDANSNDSQDSGLGEDSDLGDLSVVTSPRTPPPCNFPVPILRLTTCSTSTTASKKHVVILEPNRTELPSVRRQLFRLSAPPRLETVRIRAPRCESETRSEPNKTEEGNVSGQWDQLCQIALLETEKVISSLTGLDNFPCDSSSASATSKHPSQTISIIFATQNLNLMQERLNELDSDSVCRLIYTLYRVLFFDWMSTSHNVDKTVVAIVVHCVQRFLVVVVHVCHEFEPVTQQRLSRSFQHLLNSSEENRYRDLRDCLYCTRTVYIDFWCSLLEVKKNLAPLEMEERWL